MEFQFPVLKIKQQVVPELLEALLQPQVHLKLGQHVEKFLNLIGYLLRLVLQTLATFILNQAQLIAELLPLHFLALPLLGLQLLPPVIQLQVGFQLVNLQLANLQLMVLVILFKPVLLLALAKHQHSHLKRDFILRCSYFTL